MQSNTPQRTLTNSPQAWRPNPGPQTRFLQLKCREALFGGSAGGGKSAALLIDATRHINRGYGANYTGLLLRRTFPDLEKSLILRSHQIYPQLGGSYKSQEKYWRFPRGERIYFGYCELEKDVLQYQSAEFQYIGFDELTHFSRNQYLYLISRLRSSVGIPLRMRAGTNPGGPGHDWVLERWGAWLKDGLASGEIVYYAKQDDADVVVRKGDPDALSRTFIRSKLSDNPHLANDGVYKRNLMELDRVTRARLLDGDWSIRDAKGEYFKRHWFQVVDASPSQAERIRYWDRAATGESEAAKRRSRDPDYTVGLLLARSGSVYYVEDVVRFRGNPLQVQTTIQQTAKLDGKHVRIGIEQDPGQAGVAEGHAYVRMLDGYAVELHPARQDKITRARPVSAQCEAGNVRLLNGAWNKAFLEELEEFPEGNHDDIVDALSGAHTALSRSIAPRKPAQVHHVDRRIDEASGW